MLQKLTALLLLISVVGSSFNKAIILLDYSINKSYIAAELCEKRNIPKSCCQGKCYLKKQLQKDEDGKNASSTARADEISIQWFCEELSSDSYFFPEKEVPFCDYLFKPYSTASTAVFHPPGRI